MLAVFVLFANVVEFHMIPMFMGERPMAEHNNLEPRSTGTTGAAHGNITLGKTKKNKGRIK